jgi:hypothetical protein
MDFSASVIPRTLFNRVNILAARCGSGSFNFRFTR